MSIVAADVETHLDSLRTYVERRDYAGWDPYDALNSPILRFAGSGSKWLRIAFTQFLRRCPLNLRPVLLVRPGHNPKGLGLFLEGYARLYRTHREQAVLDRMKRLICLLGETMSAGYSGPCWGYNFPWQSRVVYRPRYMPTIVNTAFIGHALLDAYESAGLTTALDMAVGTKEFVLNDLNRNVEGETFCFSYTPMDRDYVHNANALGASLLFRIGTLTADARLQEIACRSMQYCVNHQREDGAWPYAEARGRRWVDSFHTGYVLESLRRFRGFHECSSWRSNYERGVRYYAEKFFLEDGTPKYYCDRTYPIDIHSPTEAICFFSAEGQRYRRLTETILHWMLKNLYDKKGGFYFRKVPLVRTKLIYMRWSQAWAFRALTGYYCACRQAPITACS
ncbi:MAG TPA: hypothetical protein PLU87_17920 [Sedimentisphaerales bacterium]|nr:hypothetical protein [Sedimentisphaerales bacterium]HRS12896.1 hypothetical protein [Sedimentisphaerales bacterium]HRV49502.1 hypothetical protein [Sedimentisphaerales bacterium]